MYSQQMMNSMGHTPASDREKVSYFKQKWKPLIESFDKEIQDKRLVEHVKGVAAVMLEQQMQSLLIMNEDSRAQNVGPYMKYVFPVIRRAALNLVATSIASVQPLMGPVGGIAFYKPTYGSNKGGISKGDEMNRKFNRHYSSNFIDGELVGSGDGAVLIFNKSLEWPRVLANSLNVKVDGVTVATDNGAGALTPVGAALTAGSVVYQTGQIALQFAAAPSLNSSITVEYKYDNEANSRIPEVNLDIEVLQIKAESRKLKSLTSVEASDDLRALWNRDIDADLIATMADEMTAEIDREIVYTALEGVDSDPIVWDRARPSGVSDPEHLKELLIRMSRAARMIQKRTLRGAANYAVTSPDVAALMDMMEGFAPSDSGMSGSLGVVKAGSVRRKYDVYVDSNFPENEILMGYQGSSILDTGLIYSPYIPMEITPLFMDTDNYMMKRAIRTRHKVSLVRPEFFSKVQISNLV